MPFMTPSHTTKWPFGTALWAGVIAVFGTAAVAQAETVDLPSVVSACQHLDEGPRDWAAALPGWQQSGAEDADLMGLAWAENVKWSLAVNFREEFDDLDTVTHGFLERFEEARWIIRRNLQEDFWEVFSHPTGWSMGVWHNIHGPGIYCYIWNWDDQTDALRFLAEGIAQDRSWSHFTHRPEGTWLMRELHTARYVRLIDDAISLRVDAAVLNTQRVPDAPVTYILVETARYWPEESL